MSTSTSLPEKQRYFLAMGELADGLLRLETAIRRNLCAVDNVELPLAGLKVRARLPETAFTSGQSFGELVKAYNATFKTKSRLKKYGIDEAVLWIRNAWAHGRIVAVSGDGVPCLVNFTPRKKNKDFVEVESVIIQPEVWARTMIPEIARQVARVEAAQKRQMHKA